MKISIFVLVAILAFTAHGSVRTLLKESNFEDFPAAFYWQANTVAPTGVPANATYRLDGNNNIFSYSLTFMNTAFGRNTTETTAYDFNRNQTYRHSTGNDMCVNQTMQYTLNANVMEFVNYVWNHYAKVVDEREEKGHHFVTIEVPYDSQDDIFMRLMDNNLNVLNGTFGGSYFFQNATRGFTEKFFIRGDHIPRACGF